MAGRKRETAGQTPAADLEQALVKASPEAATPLRLVQHENDGPTFLIYATDRGVRTELRFEGDSPWFTQRDLATMFGVDTDTVGDHIQKFLADAELDASTTGKFPVVRNEGGRQVRREIIHYSLDVAFYVGYRVNSAQGLLFRRWATAILIQIAKHGYFIDKERLKSPDAGSVIDEIKNEIYEIRAATANAYREVLRIVSLCSDYDGGESANALFARMENKMLFATTGRTAPELIVERADAAAPNMGLTYHTGKRGPIQKDVKVGNNYLFTEEAQRKNRATVMLLDYFEEQADQGRLVTLAECESKIDAFIRFNQWELLTNAGSVSRDAANRHALEQLKLFKGGGETGGPHRLPASKRN
jgi:hypothetical protein